INVTVGSGYSLAEPTTIAIYVGFALTVATTLAVAAKQLGMDAMSQPAAMTFAATTVIMQLAALALWNTLVSHWATIAGLLVLAAWFYVLGANKALSHQKLIRLSFLALGQLSVMLAGTLMVVEFGGNGSLQRLVTGLIATSGAAILAWRSDKRFSDRQLAL